MRSFLFAGLVGLLLVNAAFSLNKQRDCKCRFQTNSRIIGGRESAPNAIPWQITYQQKESYPVPDHLRKLLPDKEKTQFHNCGGSIINENWILIAAHCVRGQPRTGIPKRIGYGSNDLGEIFVKKQYKEIETFYMHPKHQPFYYDVALIKLKEPLVFSHSVQPACLDFTARSHYDAALKISGWGLTSSYSNVPRFLKEAEVYDHSDDSSCRREQNICLRNERNYDTSCLGDSGGPIHYTKNGKSSVVGVSSFVSNISNGSGRYRCTGDMAYTRLSSFKSFVEGYIGQNYCS